MSRFQVIKNSADRIRDQFQIDKNLTDMALTPDLRHQVWKM